MSVRHQKFLRSFWCLIFLLKKGKEKETNLRVGEGYDTMERIQKVNQACGTDITLEELLISPQTIEEKVENKKNSYNEALMDRD